MELIQPTAFVKKYAPWSISKAKAANTCPYKFKLQYVLKEKARLTAGKEARVGQCVHEVLEMALAGRPVKTTLPLIIQQHGLTTDEEDMALAFETAIVNFVKRLATYRRKINAKEPVMERKMGLSVDGRAVNFYAKDVFMRGVLDMYMFIHGRPHAVVLDHKTGKDRGLEPHEAQFEAYLAMMKAVYPELTGVSIGVNFLQTDHVEFFDNGRMRDVRDITPLMNRVINYLNTATRGITDLDLCKVTKLCGWCDFRNVCPKYSDGTNGSETKQ